MGITGSNGKIHFHRGPDKHRDIVPRNILRLLVVVEGWCEDDDGCNAHTGIGVSTSRYSGRKRQQTMTTYKVPKAKVM